MCGYGGSIESNPVKRDPFGKEQPLQPLLLIERGLHPQVRRPRQDALSEGQKALHVKFFQLLGLSVDLCEGQFLADLVALAFVGALVDRVGEQERIVQPVLLVLKGGVPWSMPSCS